MICPYCNKELEYTGIPDCHSCTNPKCFMSYYEDVENVIWRDLIANKKTSEALRWTRNVLSAIYLKTGNEWIQEILIEIRNLMLGVSMPYKYVLFKPVREKTEKKINEND